MYTDLYLSFVDQEQADSFLYTVHPAQLDDDGVTVSEEYTTSNYANIDTLGIIYQHQDDPDVEPIPEEGWHVNVRLLDNEDGAPLIPFQVYPTVPRRVWG